MSVRPQYTVPRNGKRIFTTMHEDNLLNEETVFLNMADVLQQLLLHCNVLK